MGLFFDTSHVLALPTFRGNPLMEVTGGSVLQKLPWADLFEGTDPVDPAKWTEGGGILGDPAAGTVVESGGKVAISTTRTAVTVGKSIDSNLTFNGGIFETELDTVSVVANNGYVGIAIYKDANNHAYIVRRRSGSDLIHYFLKTGGVTRENINVADASANLKFKIEDDGTDIHVFYDISGSWVEFSTGLSHNKSIGANYEVRLFTRQAVSNVTASADFLYISPTGTNVFWDIDSVTTFVNLSEPAGAIIPMGDLAIGALISDPSSTADIAFGTLGFLDTDLDEAGLRALGDKPTNNGNVTIRINSKNGTDQTTFTSLQLPDPLSVGGARHRILTGVGKGVYKGIG